MTCNKIRTRDKNLTHCCQRRKHKDVGESVPDEGQKSVSWAEVVEKGFVSQDIKPKKVQGTRKTKKLNLMLIRVK